MRSVPTHLGSGPTYAEPMRRPFSERVAGPDWRRETEQWIIARLEQRGHRLTGAIEQPRIRPWSTQMVVTTDAGRLWFKANCASMAFEPLLHAELARLVPASVDEPYAIDAGRGWMLTVDRGTTLGESHEPTLADWRAVLAEAASVQRIAADHRDQIHSTGLPDCSPATVVDRFDRILQMYVTLPEEHPAHVSPELASRLRGARPAIVDACDLLVASTLPTTWQHGDIHPWNVFAVGTGSLRIFDFGDAQWSHAAEILSVPHGWITSQAGLRWDDVVEAYCEVWGLERHDLSAQWDAVCLTQPINRAMTWWACLDEASAVEWVEWGDAPSRHLSRVLEP